MPRWRESFTAWRSSWAEIGVAEGQEKAEVPDAHACDELGMHVASRSIIQVAEQRVEIFRLKPATDLDATWAWPLLDAGEQQRADNMRHPGFRRRFVRGRALLKRLLADRLGIQPRSVLLPDRTAAFEPARSSDHSDELHFSVSHSSENTVIALSDHSPVGIDIELRRDIDNLPALFEQICSAQEYEQVSSCPALQNSQHFLRLWTLKEAYLKGLAVGLMRDPRTFSVLDSTGAICLDDPSSRTQAGHWTLLVPEIGADDLLIALALRIK